MMWAQNEGKTGQKVPSWIAMDVLRGCVKNGLHPQRVEPGVGATLSKFSS